MVGDKRLGRQEGSTGSVPNRSRHGEEADVSLGKGPGLGLGRTRIELELERGRPSDVVSELSAAAASRSAHGRTTVVRPAQLPAAVADFTGRSVFVNELSDRLAAVLDRDRAPVLAISGTGGIGKTALAIHVSHTARSRFPDGQLYVDLQGAGASPADPEAVLGAFLRALGTPDSVIPDGTVERATLYRSLLARRRVLVLLDNARDAAQVRQLLPGSPSCAALVTSRTRMADLPESHLVDLAVMTPSEAFALFAHIVGEERAGVEHDAVMDVVTSCGFLPLAIRIAGSRLAARRTWTVSALAEKLADERRRLDELRAGDLAVKATFELGYGQLEPQQARGFRLLGLAAGPDISAEAAAAVLDLDIGQTERLLGSLVDISLMESATPGRYRFHDLVRLYAWECAHSDEQPEAERGAALSRLLDFYLATGARVYAMERPGDRTVEHLAPTDHPGLSFTSSAAALDWLFAEADCLIACARQCVGETTRRRAADLLMATVDLAESGAKSRQYEAAARAISEAARQSGDVRAEGHARLTLGHLYQLTGRLDQADAELRRSLELGTHIRDPMLACRVPNQRSLIALQQGRNDEAEIHLGQALQAFRADDNEAGEASALSNLARLHLDTGRVRSGVELAEQAVSIYRRLGTSLRLANGMYVLGIALTRTGSLDEALDLLTQALGIFRENRQSLWEGMTHFRLAETLLAAHRPDQAAEHAERAIALGGLGGERRRGSFLTILGKALIALGQTDRARECLREALAICRHAQAPECREVQELLSACAADSCPTPERTIGHQTPFAEMDPWPNSLPRSDGASPT
ncbi:tetratricopeptide repeat protein [Streptomyces luomodiensis]|uniref:Tetratricopeptide repeat protein n=1 Tax=Streptomyces luomodiensis TaxID=3026192 RepID=A0ABY9V1X7_9ACTN|nr:tetratricopeptide repeat protein [Streptomyces sp. SCA4-21]WNE98287.1 tetratricopeptide repeat protein [Streptomyces sp. SCA4-21]